MVKKKSEDMEWANTVYELVLYIPASVELSLHQQNEFTIPASGVNQIFPPEL